MLGGVPQSAGVDTKPLGKPPQPHYYICHIDQILAISNHAYAYATCNTLLEPYLAKSTHNNCL